MRNSRMYERMLNKREGPERVNVELYCGYMAEEFHRLNIWLAERAQTSQKSHFHMESIMARQLHIEKDKS